MTNEDKLKFKKLFGIEPESFGDTVIISPFLGTKFFKSELKSRKDFKGLIYKGASGIYKNKKVTYVKTGIGQTPVADCVLAQDTEKITAIIFLGAVGAVNGLGIADCVLIERASLDDDYYRKFGINLKNSPQPCDFHPQSSLVKTCESVSQEKTADLKTVNVLSLGSLWQQDKDMALDIKMRGFQAVDLECAIFYAAAKRKKIKALALCFVSDLILTRPYWRDFSLAESLKIKKSINLLVKVALEICALL